MELPKDLKYSKDHEWIKIEDGVGTVGITSFAQSELGDIVFIDIDTEGESLEKEEVFGSVEAVKTVSDLFMPVNGKIIEYNSKLDDNPELINSDPYGDGWIVKVLVSDLLELEELLDHHEYNKLIT